MVVSTLFLSVLVHDQIDGCQLVDQFPKLQNMQNNWPQRTRTLFQSLPFRMEHHRRR